jgi:hypothetical protein
MAPLPPGCKRFTVTRSIHGETVTLTVLAPTAQAASRIADERAAELREVR